jgi:DNA-directed RNA polymerase specialized sigma24 family protein
MGEHTILTDESFSRLLAWLDADREAAGEKYEQIRQKLIKIFRHRGSIIPEELADATIDRVSRKIAEIAATYDGDPASYFYGVANYIYQESLRRESRPLSLLPLALSADEQEQKFHCLEQCLGKLSTENRQLILAYYEGEKGAKVDRRKALLAASGLPVNTFRMRIHRLKQSLHSCLQDCMKRAGA